jgi:hypothetical protein
MLNPLRKNKVYLRKKTSLMGDYLLGILGAATIGTFI